MCQATAYLAREGRERSEEIMQDIILLETTVDGVEPPTMRTERRNRGEEHWYHHL